MVSYTVGILCDTGTPQELHYPDSAIAGWDGKARTSLPDPLAELSSWIREVFKQKACRALSSPLPYAEKEGAAGI